MVALVSIMVDLRKDLGRFGGCSGSIWEQIWVVLVVYLRLIRGDWEMVWVDLEVDQDRLGRLGSDQVR